MRFQIQHRVDIHSPDRQKMFYVIEKLVSRASGNYFYNTVGKFPTRQEAEELIKARRGH